MIHRENKGKCTEGIGKFFDRKILIRLIFLKPPSIGISKFAAIEGYYLATGYLLRSEKFLSINENQPGGYFPFSWEGDVNLIPRRLLLKYPQFEAKKIQFQWDLLNPLAVKRLENK